MGEKSDLTVYTCMRLLPSRDGYIKHIIYIETLSGGHPDTQAIRLKQLYYDFQADYVAMDTQGNGLGLYDSCVKILYDKERDSEYPAWTAMNSKEMKSRALDDNAAEVIYSIKIHDAETNHKIAMNLKNDFSNKKIKLLVNDMEAKEHLSNKYNLLKKSAEEKSYLLNPFVQTTILINELINLEYEVRNSGFVRLKEVGENRKDRYSSLAYANHYARILEEELDDINDTVEADKFMFFD